MIRRAKLVKLLDELDDRGVVDGHAIGTILPLEGHLFGGLHPVENAGQPAPDLAELAKPPIGELLLRCPPQDRANRVLDD